MNRQPAASGFGTIGERDARAAKIVGALSGKPLVLVGLMGAGKSSLGKRLAQRLRLPFADADAEIELAAKMTIPEIFERHGEAYFRDGEKRVLARMLREGCRVVATGGGAFMNAETRRRIAESAFSVWLKADVDVLVRRVKRRTDRPLLKGVDPTEAMQTLMNQRYPIYAESNIIVQSRDAPHDEILEELVRGLEDYFGTSRNLA